MSHLYKRRQAEDLLAIKKIKIKTNLEEAAPPLKNYLKRKKGDEQCS